MGLDESTDLSIFPWITAKLANNKVIDIYCNPATTKGFIQWPDYLSVKDINVNGWYTHTGTF